MNFLNIVIIIKKFDLLKFFNFQFLCKFGENTIKHFYLFPSDFGKVTVVLGTRQRRIRFIKIHSIISLKIK